MLQDWHPEINAGMLEFFNRIPTVAPLPGWKAPAS
jgi:hypothetical protein